MIYIVCPTCGYFIGSLAIEFDKKKAEICANTDLTEEQQADEIQKLLKGLKIRRYCCRMRIMTIKDIVQDIIPSEN
jgi:DNA-directed RNA polymerase subunit N (RpoN/RPB10)